MRPSASKTSGMPRWLIGPMMVFVFAATAVKAEYVEIVKLSAPDLAPTDRLGE